MASAAYKFNLDGYSSHVTTTETHTTTTMRAASLEEGIGGASLSGDPSSSAGNGSLTGNKDTGCSAARVKSCMKMFFAQLFSHVGLCALVAGYAIMGAFIFVYLEKDNELQTRVKVGDTRKVTLDELYNITDLIKIVPRFQGHSGKE